MERIRIKCYWFDREQFTAAVGAAKCGGEVVLEQVTFRQRKLISFWTTPAGTFASAVTDSPFYLPEIFFCPTEYPWALIQEGAAVRSFPDHLLKFGTPTYET